MASATLSYELIICRKKKEVVAVQQAINALRTSEQRANQRANVLLYSTYKGQVNTPLTLCYT